MVVEYHHTLYNKQLYDIINEGPNICFMIGYLIFVSVISIVHDDKNLIVNNGMFNKLIYLQTKYLKHKKYNKNIK